MICPLCEAKELTFRYYTDNIVWVADCLRHPNLKIIVLKRHTMMPTPQEKHYMQKIIRKLLFASNWRGPKSMPEHYHLHEY